MTTFDASRSQDKTLILKRIPVFNSCTDEQLHFIAERTRLVEYKKGEYIYQQGAPADAFYMVSSGRLRVFSIVGGQEKTLVVLHNGDSFGEISLLTGETHSVTVQAINDTLVLQLEKKDFEDVINKVPSLVLYLSRLLSKRLRTKEDTGEFAEATIVALYSAARGVGRTSFAVALAATLVRETRKPVAVVDVSLDERSNPLYGERGAASVIGEETPKDADIEALLDAAVSRHPLGFSAVSARSLLRSPNGEHLIAPLLSALTRRFSYILTDLPVEVTPAVLKALTQADLIYLMTDAQREHVVRTKALIHQIQPSVGTIEQRVKVILNLLEGEEERLPAAQVREHLGLTVSTMLPHVSVASGTLTLEELTRLLESRASPYALTVRRLARELGGLLVGLALGSGAALGLAHIGVLKVLEREKIPIDLVAGSSIGALVGGLWAAGRSAEALEQMALRFKRRWDIRKLFILDLGIPVFSVIIGIAAGLGVGLLAGFWTGLMFGFIVALALGVVLGPLAGGPIQGARLMKRLQQDFGNKTFEETWLPLKIVAANPMAREEIVFDSGPIADAVRASVSIPGIFKPVIRFGKVCLDGGVVNPVPVSVLKRAGANRVIAVNVFPTTAELSVFREEVQRRRAERDAQLAARNLPTRILYRVRQELIRSISPLVFDVIMRSMQSMEYQIAEVACREADVTLRPTVPGSHWLEFFSPEKFILRGEEVALQHLPELKRLAGVTETS